MITSRVHCKSATVFSALTQTEMSLCANTIEGTMGHHTDHKFKAIIFVNTCNLWIWYMDTYVKFT